MPPPWCRAPLLPPPRLPRLPAPNSHLPFQPQLLAQISSAYLPAVLAKNFIQKRVQQLQKEDKAGKDGLVVAFLRPFLQPVVKVGVK